MRRHPGDELLQMGLEYLRSGGRQHRHGQQLRQPHEHSQEVLAAEHAARRFAAAERLQQHGLSRYAQHEKLLCTAPTHNARAPALALLARGSDNTVRHDTKGQVFKSTSRQCRNLGQAAD